MNNKFKGIWIPAEIWKIDNLTIIEKLFLVEINSLDSLNQGCFASNNHFSNHYRLSPQRCSQIIQNLIKKKFINAEYIKIGKLIKKRVLRVSNKFDRYQINSQGVSNKCIRGIKLMHKGYQINAEGNNTINNTINKKEQKNKYFLSVLPKSINIDKWKKWIDYRISIKKKITLFTAKSQIKFLLKHKNYKQIIDKSIMMGWIGLFEEKKDSNPNKNEYIIKEIK